MMTMMMMIGGMCVRMCVCERETNTVYKRIYKQEGHDGPGVAHLSFPDYEV